jgi:hypothetical protein
VPLRRLRRRPDKNLVDVDVRGWEIAYITARAMSSGSRRPSPGLSKNGVSTMPGSISVVRIPVSLRSARIASPIAAERAPSARR